MIHYRKNKLPDRRFRSSKTLQVKEYVFWRKYGNYICVALLGALAGAILTKTIWDAGHKPLLTPKGTGNIKIIQEVEAQQPPTWNDAIRQIFPKDEAGRMIRICLAESGNKYAIGHNNNGTYDYGPCQINSCHKPRGLSDAEWKAYLDDPVNNAKEVRKIYLSQGWGAWVVSRWTK